MIVKCNFIRNKVFYSFNFFKVVEEYIFVNVDFKLFRGGVFIIFELFIFRLSFNCVIVCV